ncbi:MAG TPA: sugar phosphate isomerase/epimerase [Candidatus Limnocylindrales bacterium]
MIARRLGLLAAYWTLAGDVYPGAPTEVSPFPLEDRAAAAAAAGYVGMGLVHEDVLATVGRIGYPGIRRVLVDHGLDHVELEFLNDWYLDPADPARRASDRARSELLEGAAALGARNVKVSPHLFDEGEPDIPLIRDEFARLCEQAREVGTNIVIEMMPFTNVDTIERAMAIIAGAGQSNGGILLDIWHVERPGIPFAEIATIPARFLLGVELDDAAGDVVGTLFEDTRFHRRLPGEGSFDVPGFVRAVEAAGFDAPYYGVEIISETYRRQPLEVMARTSFDATIRQVQIALAEPAGGAA